MKILQEPNAGSHSLLFRGDTVQIRFHMEPARKGRAYLMTNLGEGKIQRKEIIEYIETRRAKSGQDWHDTPLEESGEGEYSATIALIEVGHFEGKCFFMPADSGEPVWAEGENFHINVGPAVYCCANSIYCAFVRQFGPNKDFKTSQIPSAKEKKEISDYDNSGYTVIPPSGTFRNLIKELDHIVDRLNCRILHLLPINPVPTVFARMGRYGSPYASLDFTAIDPAYIEFDRKATPVQQFLELIDAAHRKDAKVFIDLAINHTGWAAKLHEEHPEWLLRDPDGSIHSPGAWGITWGDLTELDHNKLELWQYFSRVFLTWCGRGVDGFRCDAGYMIPEPAWQFIIATVREQYPDTIFLLEGLGGDPAVTRRLLNYANMNWAYSELFQNYTKEQIQSYLPYAQELSFSDGLMVHYAETHDNARLAGVSPAYARMRTALCALTSSNGAFGFTNGVEFFATEKIEVHESNALNWKNQENQIPHISRLNSILISHPAFYNNSSIRFIDSGNTKILAFLRTDSAREHQILVLINLNCENFEKATWTTDEVPVTCTALLDLITEEDFIPYLSAEKKYSMVLAMGQVLCLSPSIDDMRKIHDSENRKILKPDRIDRQRAAAVVLDVVCWLNKSEVLIDTDVVSLASLVLSDPVEFCRKTIFDKSGEIPVVFWEWPRDIRRKVIVPPDHFIFIKAPYRFRARITGDDGKTILVQRDSLRQENTNSYFAIFPPCPAPDKQSVRKIKMSVYADPVSKRESSELLFLPDTVEDMSLFYGNREIRSSDNVFLQTNGRGAMLRAAMKWGELPSRYDALLAANLNPEFPEDRHIMWRRCRIWVRFRGRSVPLSIDSTENFIVDEDGSGVWTFNIPIGNGIFVSLCVTCFMMNDRNVTGVNIYRENAKKRKFYLDDNTPVTLVIRPDIEDRNFHHRTIAMNGPEKIWPGAVTSTAKYFNFKPSPDRTLNISTLKGQFHKAPEWNYSVYQFKEAQRGLEAQTDLFSPGYFEVEIGGGECEQILGQAITPFEKDKIQVNLCRRPPDHKYSSFEQVLETAMKKFIVKREKYKTVIAGYPWFLDWGRDTLICARGMIAAGMTTEVREILMLFAKFAEKGTIPNMIHGNNAANRDTSDAPLWLFTACRDLCEAEKSFDFLEEKTDNSEKIIDILQGIAQYYVNGTPNGISCDPESGLVFSPSHFTWMDTNYPAGTPREGYPVEIQALWFAALDFLAKRTGDENWKSLATKVKKSIFSSFRNPDRMWLSDCLHGNKGTRAADALPDDSLRPNQLLCITLGAIDDFETCRNILISAQELLVPGAIRSLADKQVEYQLPIISSDGRLLNHPSSPYWGRYEGDEDNRRKPAYHNGTAWTWQFPLYAEAHYRTFGNNGADTARAILSSSLSTLMEGCAGNIPEIMDGDIPHTQRGCDAQAWGVTELYRVWKMLN